MLRVRLIASLFGNQEVEDFWAAEVERRIEEIENGRAKMIPAEEAIARARGDQVTHSRLVLSDVRPTRARLGYDTHRR
jgi:hypothetical protein